MVFVFGLCISPSLVLRPRLNEHNLHRSNHHCVQYSLGTSHWTDYELLILRHRAYRYKGVCHANLELLGLLSSVFLLCHVQLSRALASALQGLRRTDESKRHSYALARSNHDKTCQSTPSWLPPWHPAIQTAASNVEPITLYWPSKTRSYEYIMTRGRVATLYLRRRDDAIG